VTGTGIFFHDRDGHGAPRECADKGLANFRENLGKLLVDLGKLIFGSLFLGDILRGELPQVIEL